MSHSRAELFNAAAQPQAKKIRLAQSSVLAELKRRKVPVQWAGQILANAIYVRTTADVAAQLATVPGVARVVYLPPLKLDLNTALNLMNIPQAQNALGGAAGAGAGIKIGIIDSGIDQNHPGFQDPSLKPPAGFPIGDPSFTNNKVIAARSYTTLNSSNDPNYSTPDDPSPRDHTGHGTAIAMIAAGVQNTGPVATIQGVAPKAFLGNYRVWGSPGVNDFASYAAVQSALEDALSDGMDIVTLALSEGYTIGVGPLDTGAACGIAAGQACDAYASFVENAVQNGMVVVTSAGNDGNIGQQPVTYESIHTPGTDPGAITVGASTNAHVMYQAVRVKGSAPASLQNLHALFGDGPRPGSPLTAPLLDVAQVGSDGLACAPLPAGSLNGSIVLIQRGTCSFNVKINIAANAGALGVVIYQSSGIDSVFSSLGAQDTGIPAVMIGNTDGSALKSYVDANSGTAVTLDPAFSAVGTQSNVVAPYSSRGPSIGTFAATPVLVLKPELVATGDAIYTATQKFDPAGNAYDATGYTSVGGTSYAVPMVAGAVAMVKQKNGGFTPAQLKSAVVNTASQSDIVDATGNAARVTAVGAGKLKADDALNIGATLDPATLSFGAVTSTTVSTNLTLKVTAVASGTFNFTVQQRDADSHAAVTVSPASLTLTAGQTNSFTVSLKGSRPNAGSYEGSIVVSGPGSTLHVPYQYLVGSGVPADIYPVFNGSFLGGPGDTNWLLGFRVVDSFGVPVANLPVQFTVTQGGGKIALGDAQTDVFGGAGAYVNLGTSLGDQIFTATAGNLSIRFDGYVRNYPAISSNGVVNAATNQAGQGMAAGSYIAIYGSNLADATATASTPSLPVSLSNVAVSFDGGGLSLPGRVYFVSPGQVDVQIPWEFQGQTSVQMKVTALGYMSSYVYTVPLATYSPGIFAVVDSQSGAVGSAKRGDTLVIYMNGLGPVSSTPSSGDPTPSTQPLASTGVSPSVTIGGSTAQVLFSGLTPGSIGLYQVNATIPSNAPTGTQPLVVTIAGVASQPVNLAVQ
jgi:minor extracellular serine protease Vpr